jgi:hypothetical protein
MKYQRAYVETKVYVNGKINPHMKVLECEETQGGGRMNFARLAYDLGHRQVEAGRPGAAYLSEHSFYDGKEPGGTEQLAGAEIEIVGTVDGLVKVYHWGHLGIQSLEIADKESFALTSRMVNSDFGIPLGGQRVVDPKTNKSVWIHPTKGQLPIEMDIPIVFNPEHTDGTIRGNKRIFGKEVLFINPASTETEGAQQYQNLGRSIDLTRWVAGFSDWFKANQLEADANENWSLADACFYLLEATNGVIPWLLTLKRQPRILNPSLEQIKKILPTDRSQIKNHQIRVGAYLPEALDALLEPYGYTWKVNLVARGARVIEIIKLGTSDKKIVARLDRPANPNHANTDAWKTNIHFDTQRVFNQVRIQGGKTQIEATFPLSPAWPTSHDDLTTDNEDNVVKDSQSWDSNPDYHRTWRDWVLGEAGDYQRSRAFDLTPLFRAAFGKSHPPVVAKRRQFLPMLSADQDGEPYGKVKGCYIEWEDDTGVRRPLPVGEASWSIKLLKNECGITFTGNQPPPELYDLGASGARIWITATIESDTRISAVAKRKDTSANPDIVELVVQKPLSFHLHTRLATGDYKSKFSSVTKVGDPDDDAFPVALLSKELDGRVALNLVAETIRQSVDQAECSGTITLDGIDRLQYETGTVITELAGRAINFKVNGESTLQQYPQIVGVKYLPQQQITVVMLKSFRTTESRLAELLRRMRALK